MDLFRKKDIRASLDYESHLAKCLTFFDLTFLGIGAIIGAGIFIMTGIAAATLAGPALIFSYVIAGAASAFAALSYAELAASIGGCGGAYSYAYIGFGELIAWIVGWDLLLEYGISVSAVSVGWSSYTNDLLLSLNLHLPKIFLHGPKEGGILNLLSFIIDALLTLLLIMGAKSSTRVNNVMVTIKLLVILLFIAIASTEVHIVNWFPFMPFGWSGVIKGASLIFFAYIGFDAVSTAAEEAINPQRDMPRGILSSLIVCTVLYIAVAGLLTAIAHYPSLDNASPLSHSLLVLGYKTAAGLIGVGAVAGITTVMLVLFYGLTRVFLAMSRDGLLPLIFAKINDKTRTPVRIIVLCGLFITTLSSLVPMRDLAELVNIGTLFAFIVVCFGVLYLRYTRPEMERPFKTPGMPYVPILGIFSCAYLMMNLPWVTLLRFIVWMVTGLLIYFNFSWANSVLQKK